MIDRQQENLKIETPNPKIPFLKKHHQEKVDQFGNKTNVLFNSWADKLHKIIKKLS